MGRCFNGILVENLVCTCGRQCGRISSDNHRSHTYTALKEIRTSAFINPDTVASRFAFLYTNWKKKIRFYAKFLSEDNQ